MGTLALNFSVVAAVGAGAAKGSAVADYFAAVVDAFTALFAHHARNRTAGLILEGNVDLESFDDEQFVVREELVCIELARISVLYLGKGEICLVPLEGAGN